MHKKRNKNNSDSFLKKKRDILENKLNSSIDQAENVTRRSQRERKLPDIELINCHQCKMIDNLNNAYTCSNNDCHESYCMLCLKQYYVYMFN